MASQKGSVSERLLRTVRRFREQKVIDFWKIEAGRKLTEDVRKTVASLEDLSKLHPAFALYAYAQNEASVLSEQITQLPPMKPFVDLIGKAEDEYVPQGPPMSPLTLSYFTCWALFDACVGNRRETIGTCIIAVGREIGIPADILQLISALVESRMGLYLVQGFDASTAILREMVTGVECRAIVPSGHRGKRGELWLVRVLPPPVPGSTPHVVFTTPYIIIRPGPDEWSAYFSRTLPPIDPDERRAYEVLMKYGPTRSYWSEYIFEAYVNHTKEAILLAGLPDVEESRPHSRANW